MDTKDTSGSGILLPYNIRVVTQSYYVDACEILLKVRTN
jgi:hypothetical protein